MQSYDPLTSQKASIEALAALIRSQLGLSDHGNHISIDRPLAQFAIQRHRIGSLLPVAAKQNPRCDEAAAQVLLAAHQANIMSELSQRAASQKVSALLDANDIEFTILKGAGIAAQLYKNPQMRQSKDIDILVSPKDCPRAVQLLNDEGYLYKPYSLRPKTHVSIAHQLSDMALFKDLSFIDQKYSVEIELHQRLFRLEPKTFTDDFNAVIKFQKIPRVTQANYSLYFILHGAMSYWARLKWVIDLSLLAQKLTCDDLDKILKLAKSYDVETAVIASLLFMEDIFPDSLETDWADKIRIQCHKKKGQNLIHIFNHMLTHSDGDRPTMTVKRPFFSDAAHDIFGHQVPIVTIILNRIKSSLRIRL